MQSLVLKQLLAERSLEANQILALRICLDPRDRCSDFTSLDDVIKAKVVGTYERMQNGRKLGNDSLVLTFTAEAGGRARLHGLRRFLARRKGIAPGDIVYDYDAAHLFHNFITRARCPVFYDSFEIAGMDDLVGRLVVTWPRPIMRSVQKASHSGLVIVSS